MSTASGGLRWPNLQAWTDLAADEMAANRADGRNRTDCQAEAVRVIERHLTRGDITAEEVDRAAARSFRKAGLPPRRTGRSRS